MLINEYANLAMRTNDGKCSIRVENKLDQYFRSMSRNAHGVIPEAEVDPGELLNGALGLTGEAGEVSDMIKKYMFHGHALNKEDLIKELGDCAWYLAMLCHAIDVDLEEVLTRNIDKLKRRYPGGFSESASINRTE